MKRMSIFFLFLFFFSAACKQSEKEANEPESDIDAARYFLRAALDGRFDKASDFLLKDSANLHYMDLAKRTYESQDNDTKYNYRNSSINIHNLIEVVKDSLSVVVFSNSFTKDQDSLKVLRTGDHWRIDLKYLYEHELDTTLNRMITKDTTGK
jgi:hypothetical protein